jgi:NitT/TauT family transport system substrate-binding protein
MAARTTRQSSAIDGAARARRWGGLLGALVLLVLGCTPAAGPSVGSPPAAAAPPAAPPPAAAPPAAPAVAAAAPERVALKVAVLGITAGAGNYLGAGQGYFAEEGLDVEFVPFRTGVEQIPALATGQLDVGAGATGGALFNAIAQDLPIRIVADHGGIRNGWSSAALVLRKELLDGGRVHDYADLRGLRYALTSTAGNATQVELDKALRQGGMRIEDVEVAELGFPETLSALSNNAVDGTVIVEPFVTLAEERGLGGIWRRVPEYLPVHQTGVLIYGPSIMQAPGDVAVRFMKGYLRGARDYNVAVERRDAAVREQVIAILMEHTTLKDRALYDRISYAWLDPDGRVVMDSIADDLSWYVDHGYVRERLDVARVVDSSFAERAVAQLGPFASAPVAR